MENSMENNMEHNRESFSSEDSIKIICDLVDEFYTTKDSSEDGSYEFICPLPLGRVHFLLKEMLYDGIKNLSEKDIEDIQLVFNLDFWYFHKENIAGNELLYFPINDLNSVKILIEDINKINNIISNFRQDKVKQHTTKEISDSVSGKEDKEEIFYTADNKYIIENNGMFYLFDTSNNEIEGQCGDECIAKYNFGNNKIMIFRKEEYLDLSQEEKNNLLNLYSTNFDEFQSQVEKYTGFKNLKVDSIHEIEKSNPLDEDNDEDPIESKKESFLDNYYYNSYPIFLINKENILKKVDEVHDVELTPSIKDYFGEKTLVLPITKDGKRQYMLINPKKIDYFDRE